jgi:TPR repeat protein
MAGDADAQFHLGRMYYLGTEVAPDYSEAARWFRMAAEQGGGEAQYVLGTLYILGRGVTHDDVEAYTWLSLAAARSRDDESDEKYEYARALAAQRMTAQQIAEAKQRALETQRRILRFEKIADE